MLELFEVLDSSLSLALHLFTHVNHTSRVVACCGTRSYPEMVRLQVIIRAGLCVGVRVSPLRWGIELIVVLSCCLQPIVACDHDVGLYLAWQRRWSPLHRGLWVLKSALVVLVGRLNGALVWNSGKVEIGSLHAFLGCL